MKKQKRHDYETNYPVQCKEYKKIINSLYKLFLDKGKEYGPYNVKSMGSFGLAFRTNEKLQRIFNLMGWDPWNGRFKKAIPNPKFDSIEAEWQDIANVAIIALIVSRGKWAK